jgi:hypothetical protein
MFQKLRAKYQKGIKHVVSDVENFLSYSGTNRMNCEFFESVTIHNLPFSRFRESDS